MTLPDATRSTRLPKAIVSKPRRFPIVWIFPLLAAAVGGILIYDYLTSRGPIITITFPDAVGIDPGQTTIRYRGVVVGRVREVEVSDNLERALVRVQLAKGAGELAREGSLFWIVRPQLGFGTVSGLETILGGPYIQAMAGEGPRKNEFQGLSAPPIVRSEEGLRIVLLTSNLGSLKRGAPVYFRGLQVGVIEDFELARNATAVHIHAHIRPRYVPLVQAESRFWNVSGFNIDVGLFRGAEINVGSLASLLQGGIAFATPESEPDAEPTDPMVFQLHDKPQPEWLQWNPVILLPPETNTLATVVGP